MKSSNYNILIERMTDNNQSEYIIYNTYSTSIAILDSEFYNIYTNIDKIDLNDLNIQKKVKVLKDNGFIIDDKIDEFSRICIEDRINRYSKKSLDLTIAPTLACNMNCVYCYEEKKFIRMNKEVTNNLINFIENLIKNCNYETCSVKWYGGEPLLESEIIKSLSIDLIQLCEKYSIKYTATIITNGVLLNRDMATMLKETCNITSAQITIDGLKDTHNNNRPIKNGQDSFTTIINNICSIKDILKIFIRVNIDNDNKNELDALINYLIDDMKLKNEVTIYPYPIVAKNTTACDVDISKCITAKAFGIIESDFIRKLYNKGAKNSISMLTQSRSASFCTSICSNSFVIDPEGFLYPCWDFIGIKDKSIGNINEPLAITEEYSKWLLLDIPKECKLCKLLPLCKGGCPSARLDNYKKPNCYPLLMSLEEKLKIVYEDFKKGGVD